MRLTQARRLKPFSPAVIAFITGFGRTLRNSAQARAFPELVALGYWARAASVTRLTEQFEAAYPGTVRRARGLAFHIAPANVDTIFVYSLMLSMLAGNLNLVRVSSRGGEQTALLMSLMEQALAEAPDEVALALAIVRYEHDRNITDALSQLADVRIVWGGDATVGLVRESALRPTATELVFPNKFSFAVLDAGRWLAETDPDSVARRFVNDALWFGQAACSSPRLVAWLGSEADARRASQGFWPAVDRAAAAAGFDTEESQAVAKLLAEQELALEGGAEILATPTNRLRVVSREDGFGQAASPGFGFFTQYRLDSLADLAAFARRDWQTIGSYGIAAEDWRGFLEGEQPLGIDRIVPLGSALDFDRIWDGVDLLVAMTRITALPRAAD